MRARCFGRRTPDEHDKRESGKGTKLKARSFESMKYTLEVPEEDAAFVLEFLKRLPSVRILPPATEADTAELQRVEELRQKRYHSYGKSPLAADEATTS